jgi:hypothetical protein
MAQYEHLPIYKAAFDLQIYFEGIVRNFRRYHKYTHGAALRDLTREALMLIVRANNSRDKRPVLEELRIKLEEIKVEKGSVTNDNYYHSWMSGLRGLPLCACPTFLFSACSI